MIDKGQWKEFGQDASNISPHQLLFFAPTRNKENYLVISLNAFKYINETKINTQKGIYFKINKLLHFINRFNYNNPL